MRNKSGKFLAFVALLAMLFAPSFASAQFPGSVSNLSAVSGRFVARNYRYQGMQIAPGTNNPSGTQTIALYAGTIRLQDGRSITPFSAGGTNTQGTAAPLPAIPITVGAGSTQETVTPTAVSGCYYGAPQFSCKITAVFANAHGQGEVVTSGTQGLQEAINDAGSFGGGVAVADIPAITNVLLGAANVVAGVAVEDDRFGAPTYWGPLAGATTLAAPATLTAVTVGFALNGANATAGTYVGANTYHVTISCVDIFGQEGPGSADFSGLTAGTGSTNQIGIAAPAAQTGCVGYVPYISLTGGTYTLSYKVPLIAQPTAVGAATVSSGVCTLTTVETVTPACAVANTTYNQLGSNAVVSALTLNTSPIVPQSTVVSTTSVYVPNPGGRTTYSYAQTPAGSAPGLPSQWLPFVISAADATTVPSVIGTINMPTGYMNTLGKTIRVCGYGTTTASTATIEEIQLQWDAVGQNTAGKGVLVGDGTAVATWATAGHISFCEDLTTTVAAATATGGSLLMSNAFGGSSGLSSVTGGGMGGNMTAAIGSLNLAADARINVIYVHTTGTDGAAITLESLTARVL